MDVEHGVAFLIAQITGTKPSAHAARITIEFSSYAMVDVPGAWERLTRSQRFPVAYLETAELFRRLDLNPKDLAWKQLAGASPAAPVQLHLADSLGAGTAPRPAPDGKGASFTGAVADAKRKLAETLGIAAEKIEITIRL